MSVEGKEDDGGRSKVWVMTCPGSDDSRGQSTSPCPDLAPFWLFDPEPVISSPSSWLGKVNGCVLKTVKQTLNVGDPVPV